MTSGDYVLLSVTDTGHGMDEATKNHIFEPFFHNQSRWQKVQASAWPPFYGVVKQSGGFIWVISSPGVGTTFEIYLPQVSGPVF